MKAMDFIGQSSGICILYLIMSILQVTNLILMYVPMFGYMHILVLNYDNNGTSQET